MYRIAIILAFVALARPATAEESRQVYVNADGQITRVEPAEPGYLQYQYVPVDCVTLPCPNHFVLAADAPDADGIVIWSDEAPPALEASKKILAAMRNPLDGPLCWVLRGELLIGEEGTTLRVDELIGACN